MLIELGIALEAGLARGKGIVAHLGQGDAACVARRADMDALPIREWTGIDFVSRNEGAMHACGHGSHMAMSLGAARMLEASEAELRGPLELIFQPGDEGTLATGAALHVAFARA